MSRMQAQCGDLPFLIKRDGAWLYRGTPIRRKEMVCLFSSMLVRDAVGDYWLETLAERGRIEVEDAPWMAVELSWCGDGSGQCLALRTNVDHLITLDHEHPIRIARAVTGCDPAAREGLTPYVTVRAGQGAFPLEARISRPVYYELAALAVPRWVGGKRVMGVWSEGCFFFLGDA